MSFEKLQGKVVSIEYITAANNKIEKFVTNFVNVISADNKIIIFSSEDKYYVMPFLLESKELVTVITKISALDDESVVNYIYGNGKLNQETLMSVDTASLIKILKRNKFDYLKAEKNTKDNIPNKIALKNWLEKSEPVKMK